MATQTPDYAALARQAGGTIDSPANQQIPTPLVNGTQEDAARYVAGLPGTASPTQRQAAAVARPDYAALARQAGGAIDTDTDTDPKEPSMLSQIGSTAVDVAKGAAEGIGSTVHGTGELIRHGLNAAAVAAGGNQIGMGDLGNRVIPQSGQAALNQIATPVNTAQKIGYGAEQIAEFMLGDEALKGLSLAAKLKQVGPAMKLLQETPILRNQVVQKMIAAGVRQGAVGGTQEFVHSGGDLVPSLETGAVAGGLGGALEGLSSGIVEPKTKAFAKRVAETKLSETDSLMAATAKRVSGIAGNAVEDATGADRGTSSAVTFRDAATQIKDAFNPTYDELRKAAGGVINPETGRYGTNEFDDAVNQIKRAKKVIYSPSPSSTDALKTADQELVEGQEKLNTLFESNPDKYARAQAGWRKASTLEDLHSSIDKAFDEPAGVRTLEGVYGRVEPRKFVTQANKAIDQLNKKGQLESALGPEGFHSLNIIRREMKSVVASDAYGKNVERLTRQYLSQKGSSAVSKTVGGLGAGFGAGELSHLFGAGNPLTAVVGISAATLHFLYTHPETAIKVLRVAKATLPAVAAQRSQITHVFDENFGLVPVQ